MKIYGCNMNETLQQIDRISSNNIYKQLVQSLLNVINDHKLCDVWRVMDINIKQLTWRRKNGNEKR